MRYNLLPTGGDILHFGKGHDDNPPGRGSGRFAFGTGKRPKQHVSIGKPKTEEQKSKILRSANPRKVLAIQNQLSTDELQDAANRIRLNAEINGYILKEGSNKWKKIEAGMNKLDNVAKWSGTGIKLYNNFASAYNSLSSVSEGDAKPLKTIKMGKDN